MLASIMLTLHLRPPRVGDGQGLARTWIDAGHAYADRAGADIQVPEPDGLAAWLEAALVRPPTMSVSSSPITTTRSSALCWAP